MNRKEFAKICKAQGICMDFSEMVAIEPMNNDHSAVVGSIGFEDGRTESFYRGYMLRIAHEHGFSNKQSVQMNKDNV